MLLLLLLCKRKTRGMGVKDYRPISLVGGVYKILAVLTNSLKLVLGKLLSHSQNDFVEKRWILDLVLIANECLDRQLKLGIPGVLYNLDWRRPIISLIGLS